MTEAPCAATIELMSPDGYYKYLDVPKVESSASTTTRVPTPSSTLNNNNKDQEPLVSIDVDRIKKNYRKLSRKHHPDRPGGNANTFRLLNRAQRVLLNPKLRQQYDILGIDLDEDDDNEGDEDYHIDDDDDEHDDSGKAKKQRQEKPTTAQGIVQEIASMALMTMMQLGVRTIMTGVVSILVVRYRITLYPAVAFLAFTAFKIFQRTRGGKDPQQSVYDALSPIIISAGLWAMHFGRHFQIKDDGTTGFGDWQWSALFWLGEAIVIGAFTYNSVTQSLPNTPGLFIFIGVFAALASLWFRGAVWNYVTALLLLAFLGLFVALAFPVVELILEAILNEKLRKVGDRVRAHHQIIERYYADKLKEELGKQ